MTQMYDVVVGEDYEKDGEKKTAWTNIGTGFATKNDGISIELRPNLALTGRAMLFPRKDKPAED